MAYTHTNAYDDNMVLFSHIHLSPYAQDGALRVPDDPDVIEL